MTLSEAKNCADVIHGYATDNIESMELEEKGYKLIVSVEELQHLEIPLEYKETEEDAGIERITSYLMDMRWEHETEEGWSRYNIYNVVRFESDNGIILYMNEDYYRNTKGI